MPPRSILRLQAWDILCDLLFADVDTGRLAACDGNERLQNELVGLANSCLVTVSLWRALGECGFAGRLSDGVREYLTAFHELSSERSRALIDQLTECIGALNRRGIVPMPLKGAAHVLSGLYTDPAERFLSDIDLLIPAGRLDDAWGALSDIGFTESPSNLHSSRHHHLSVLVRTLDDLAVELHSAPVAREAQRGLKVDDLWAGATMEHGESGSWYAASPTDTVMLAFLHGEVIDRYLARYIVDLRGYLDLRQIIRHRGAEIDWARNLDRARTCGALRAFRRHLYVFERLTGQPVLPSVRSTVFDRAHYFLSRCAIVFPLLQRLATRLFRDRIGATYRESRQRQ